MTRNPYNNSKRVQISEVLSSYVKGLDFSFLLGGQAKDRRPFEEERLKYFFSHELKNADFLNN